MATEVRVLTERWCDWHLRVKDEKVDGQEVEFTWRRTGVKAEEPLTADLCADCEQRFGAGVSELIETLGAVQAKRTQTLSSHRKGETTKGSTFPCPDAACDYKGTESAIKHHVESRHRMMLSEYAAITGYALNGKPVRFLCTDDHKAGFTGAQGIVQHRIRTHGEGPQGIDADRFRIKA